LFAFIRRHLDPVDRLGEVLFALIMALGFTAAVRISDEQMESRELLVAIAGCNLAWGIVDGVMFVLTALFERGRKARVIRDVRSAPDEASALAAIERELNAPLLDLTSPAERDQLRRRVLELVQRSEFEPVRLRAGDLLGGAAVALVIVLATLPVVVPFLFVNDPMLAARLSNLVALVELGLVGARWANEVGASPIWIAIGLTTVGVVLVAITIALGGCAPAG
jgi:VIT1/CCC1 family predicted Fe2+/Mn2+ transporter